MIEHASENNNVDLSLRHVASWQIKDTAILHGDEPAPIQARVPSLQRGAVWEPQQIEMLWDSIFRGFPIGAIVVSQKIKGQQDKAKETHVVGYENIHGTTTHHILDGQQRCNAIAWGFVDPFQKGMRDDVILWLDLKPEQKSIDSTTREYLFRITTKAHPWGFSHNDNADILGVSQRSKFIDKLKLLYSKELPSDFAVKTQENIDVKTRPTPNLSFPADANFPVPVFLLFKHFDFKDHKFDWESFKQENWVKLAEIWCGIKTDDLINQDRVKIENGLKMAEQARLLALSVPNGLESIKNVEQIFQRLNRQGSPLDNEELVYSMMKAYWTDIEDIMKGVEKPPITEVRLVNLGVRIALTADGEKLAAALSVERIRKIFNDIDIRTEVEISEQKAIKAYFGERERDGELKKALEWIDNNLCYKKEVRVYGFPAYLRSSIAWSSPDVFAWLMLLAKQHKYELISDQSVAKKIIGLALTIHWFGVDKTKAVGQLIANSKSGLDSVTLADINKENAAKGKSGNFVLIPLNLVKMEEAFQLDENSTAEQLNNWTSFWQGIVVRDKTGKAHDEDKVKTLKDEYGLFLEKLRQLQELLVYAQREYIEDAFVDFDPANKLMWKGHNRPWDYDHILASNELNATGSYKKADLQFHEVCKAWQQSIGNQIAVGFSFNRSAQDKESPIDKYKSENSKKLNIEVFADDEDLENFGLDLSKLRRGESIDSALSFVLTTKKRFITIYREWYDSLDVHKYIGD